MGINRGPWNALVDDDGTGMVGTLWGKQDVKDVILDPADAAYANKYETVIASSTTGVQNAWNPGVVGHTTIYWIGAADLTLNGLQGGAQGARVTLKNLGTATIYVNHANGSASLGFQFGNNITSGMTPIGFYGSATWVWISNYWYMVAHEHGQWTPVPFAATNFSMPSGGTWTVAAGGIVSNKCRVMGRTLQWELAVNGTAGGTLQNYARVVIPFGWTVPGGTVYFPFGQMQNAGINGPANGSAALVDFSHMEIIKADSSAFTAGAFNVFGTATFEIV